MASVTVKFHGKEFTISGENEFELDHFMHILWYAAFEAADNAAHDGRYNTEEDHRKLMDACSAVWR